MAEFTPITTQADLDAIIGERIKRERETLSKKYSDYDTLKGKVADYENQIGEMSQAAKTASEKYAGYDKELQQLQAKVASYETASVKTRIAHEVGLPYELAGRLSGDTEEDIRKDASALAQLIGKSHTSSQPLRDTEGPEDGDSKKAALKRVLQNLKTD